MASLLNPLRHYADFSGRARRLEFWSWVLIVAVALVAMAWLDAKLGLGGSIDAVATATSFSANIQGGLLSLVMLLATLIPSLAVSVRRLHDIGRSGVFLLFILIPLFGWAYLLYLYVQPGTAGPNAYGADPKGAEAGKVFA